MACGWKRDITALSCLYFQSVYFSGNLHLNTNSDDTPRGNDGDQMKKDWWTQKWISRRQLLKRHNHPGVIGLILIVCTHLLWGHSLEATRDVLLPVAMQLSQQSYFWCVRIDVSCRDRMEGGGGGDARRKEYDLMSVHITGVTSSSILFQVLTK